MSGLCALRCDLDCHGLLQRDLSGCTMSKIPKAVSDYLAQIGRKGGKARTPAKAKAVRTNGRLGGRPRKKKAAR